MKRWIFLVWLLPLAGAHAASFNCKKASTKIEKMICGDAELSKLDEKLSAAFKAALKNESVSRQEQKQWLVVRDLCEDKACLKQAIVNRTNTLLSYAAEEPDDENCYACPASVGRYLDQRQAEIQASMSKEDAGLFAAIGKDDLAGVKKWLAKGANVNAEQEAEPEYMGGGHFQEGGTFTPLLAAVPRNKKEIIALLLAKGANVNAVDEGGFTPLALATYSAPPEIVRLLLDHGADIHFKEEDGMTLLHLAGRGGNTSAARILIAKGLDVNARTNAGQTPLHEAARNAHPDFVALLLAKGAKVDARDRDGTTPLLEMMAYSLGTTKQDGEHKVARLTETTRILLAYGANVNVRNARGATPLHLAHYEKAAELILAKGADINARDDYGNTPFHYLASNNYQQEEMIKLYLAKGGDINARNKAGKTPLDETVDRLKGSNLAAVTPYAINMRLFKKYGGKK